jgi:hypothetical protein
MCRGPRRRASRRSSLQPRRARCSAAAPPRRRGGHSCGFILEATPVCACIQRQSAVPTFVFTGTPRRCILLLEGCNQGLTLALFIAQLEDLREQFAHIRA